MGAFSGAPNLFFGAVVFNVNKLRFRSSLVTAAFRQEPASCGWLTVGEQETTAVPRRAGSQCANRVREFRERVRCCRG